MADGTTVEADWGAGVRFHAVQGFYITETFRPRHSIGRRVGVDHVVVETSVTFRFWQGQIKLIQLFRHRLLLIYEVDRLLRHVLFLGFSVLDGSHSGGRRVGVCF